VVAIQRRADLVAQLHLRRVEPPAERLRNLEVLLRIMEQEGLPLVWAWKSQLLLLLETLLDGERHGKPAVRVERR
jgi:hypothetical protein